MLVRSETIKARGAHGGSQRSANIAARSAIVVVSAQHTAYYTAVTLSAVNRRSGRTTENPPMATRISNTTPPGPDLSDATAANGGIADFDYSNFYYSSSDDIFAIF